MNTLQVFPNTCVQPAVPIMLALVGRTFVPWLMAAAVLFVPCDVAAQQIIHADGGRVSVAAAGVPLQKVLDGFAELVEMKLWVRHGVGEQLVTVELEPLPIATALYRVLLSAGVDFVMAEGAANQPMRLVIGALKGTEAVALSGGSTESRVIEPVTEPGAIAASDKPEEEEEPANQAQSTEAGTQLGPVIPSGMTPAARLVQLLSPSARPKPAIGALIELPFPGPDGQPYTVQNYRPAPGVVQLPFPDPTTGQPLEVVVPPTKPGVFTLPFPVPDLQLSPVPAAPVRAPARRPGGI